MPQAPAYILWLPSWYPNKLDPFDGDFIQRHAVAVSAFVPVHVFFLVKDEKKLITKSVHVEERKEGNLVETIIYYAGDNYLFKFPNRLFSFRQYRKLYRNYLTKLFKEKGFPSLVHVHIAFKAGIIANWIRKKFSIPYLLTEQWTIYLDEAKPNIHQFSRIDRFLISKIIKNALLVLPVSKYLGNAIEQNWPGVEWEVVPNVVNTNIFFPANNKTGDILKLVHISTLNYQKDPESLLQAALQLKQEGVPVRLDIFGPVKSAISSFIEQNSLQEQVILRGEVPQSQLATSIQEADALILYSRYETFGCVLIEANACGKPVIVPDTSLMREIVNDKENGVLVQPGSSKALANAIKSFSQSKSQFNSSTIAANTKEKYSYARVGKMYTDTYSRFMKF